MTNATPCACHGCPMMWQSHDGYSHRHAPNDHRSIPSDRRSGKVTSFGAALAGDCR